VGTPGVQDTAGICKEAVVADLYQLYLDDYFDQARRGFAIEARAVWNEVPPKYDSWFAAGDMKFDVTTDGSGHTILVLEGDLDRVSWGDLSGPFKPMRLRVAYDGTSTITEVKLDLVGENRSGQQSNPAFMDRRFGYAQVWWPTNENDHWLVFGLNNHIRDMVFTSVGEAILRGFSRSG
jgi:hypothetical protein